MEFPTTLRRLVIALNGHDGPDYFQAGIGTLKPGMVVMEDDADEVTICTPTGIPLGIVGCDADHDLSTVYDSGERIPIWLLGCGVDLYVLHEDHDTKTILLGSIIESSDDTTNHGKVKMKEANVVLTTANVTSGGTARNITPFFWIGKSLGDGTATSAIAQYIPVKLCF